MTRQAARSGATWPRALCASLLTRSFRFVEPRWIVRGAAAFAGGFALGLASVAVGFLG